MSAPRQWHIDRNEKKRVGRILANQLPAIRSKVTVAKMLGITPVGVDYTESLALFKVAAMLRMV